MTTRQQNLDYDRKITGAFEIGSFNDNSDHIYMKAQIA